LGEGSLPAGGDLAFDETVGNEHVLDAAVGQLGAHPGPNLAPSDVGTQIPSTCLMSSRSTPTAMLAALLRTERRL
jgi:hypothetical protein